MRGVAAGPREAARAVRIGGVVGRAGRGQRGLGGSAATSSALGAGGIAAALRADHRVLPGGRGGRGVGSRGVETAAGERAEVDRVVLVGRIRRSPGMGADGRGDQRGPGRRAVQGAVVRSAPGDPPRRLDAQMVLDVGLDDHHVDRGVRLAGSGDEGLLDLRADLRKICAVQLEDILGEMHGGAGVGGDARLRDHRSVPSLSLTAAIACGRGAPLSAPTLRAHDEAGGPV